MNLHDTFSCPAHPADFLPRSFPGTSGTVSRLAFVFSDGQHVKTLLEVPGGRVCCLEKEGWEETEGGVAWLVSRRMSSPGEEWCPPQGRDGKVEAFRSVYKASVGETETREEDSETGKGWGLIVGSGFPFLRLGSPAGLGDRQIGAWQEVWGSGGGSLEEYVCHKLQGEGGNAKGLSLLVSE